MTDRRQQKTFTYDLTAGGREALAEIKQPEAVGQYVRPSKMTLNEHLDEWLPAVLAARRGKGRALRQPTARNYADCSARRASGWEHK